MSTAASLRTLGRDVMRAVRGHDLALYAAGITFYAAVGLVPLLLVALFLAGVLVGQQTVLDLATELAALLPRNLGAESAARSLAETGSRLSFGGAVAALVPASLYGEGLVRAFDRLSVRGNRGRRTLRGRLGSLAIVCLSPVLLLAGLGGSRVLVDLLGVGSAARLFGVYGAFLVLWLTLSPLLALAYRGISPERPHLRALLWGAFGTGSVLAGFVLGYVLFLGIDIPIGEAYGGATLLAAAAVSGLWLYLLHIIVLVGYVLTLTLQARGGHPLARPMESSAVSAGVSSA